jgi:hypothetical protein
MHRDAVAFRLQKMAGQKNARCDPDPAIQWRPAFRLARRAG